LCIWLVLLQKYITMHGPTNVELATLLITSYFKPPQHVMFNSLCYAQDVHRICDMQYKPIRLYVIQGPLILLVWNQTIPNHRKFCWRRQPRSICDNFVNIVGRKPWAVNGNISTDTHQYKAQPLIAAMLTPFYTTCTILLLLLLLLTEQTVKKKSTSKGNLMLLIVDNYPTLFMLITYPVQLLTNYYLLKKPDLHTNE